MSISLQEISEQFLSEPLPPAGLEYSGSIAQQGPNWLDRLIDPWKQFGGSIISAGERTVQEINTQLPQMLFDWSMEKLGGSEQRTVQTGPGTSTTFTQPANPGGAPASPYYSLTVPVQQPAAQQQPAALGSTFVIVALGVILLIALKA